MDAIDAIKGRFSVRKYRNLPVPDDCLKEIMDCGRRAPCGYNRQSWFFVAVTDARLRSEIAGVAAYGRFIKDAGACIAVFGRKGEETMVEDACAATENMIIAAQALGLGTCWVNSHRKAHSQAVERILGCPQDCELIVLLAVGYPAEARTTPKKPLDEVIRWNHF